MHKTSTLMVCALVAGCAAPKANAPSPSEAPVPNAPVADSTPPSPSPSPGAFAYPVARTVDQVDDYHGTKVKDPYRWLEDDNSKETAAWVAAENELTQSFLAGVPERDAIKRRLTELTDFERFGTPEKAGHRYFFARNTGLQNQAVWYWTSALAAEPKELIDPNTLTKDGTIAVAGLVPTEDGKLVAIITAEAGSDWNEIKVRDVATGKDLPDEIKWVKFSGVSWSKDGKGFYYSRYDQPAAGEALQQKNEFQKAYFHRLGSAQKDDVLIASDDKNADWFFSAGVTEDGRWEIVGVTKGTDDKNQVWFKDLRAGAKAVRQQVFPDFTTELSMLGNVGAVFYFKTDDHAERKRIVSFDLAAFNHQPHVDIPRAASTFFKEVVPEAAETLTAASIVGNTIYAQYLKDAHSVVKQFDLHGKLLREIALPGLGTASGFAGRQKDSETFYAFTSYTQPSTIYRLDVRSGKSTVFKQPTVKFDPSRYVTDQVFYPSKDGTKIPMFIVHRTDAKLDGQNPTILYGYGGFNISLTPAFSSSVIAWLEMGGVYCIANLRGGGEYGEAWHHAGTKLHKQNVFDDFIAAAEWLIASKWTQTPRLAISGGSNGGLLVGAALTQRPELFGAALPAVGVLDMLRFHKFTIGYAWVDDYGSSDDPEQFKALYAYSPYHNVKPGTSYPAVLVTTADHDDRVVPAHSFKFTAALQAAQAGPAPILIRVDVRAGHGAGKPTAKVIDTQADVYAFLIRVLGMHDLHLGGGQ
jgi:prolyl oligopeptidase